MNCILKEKWCVKFLLPLKYNNGLDIEPSKFDTVRKELIEKFGGFTIAPFSFEGGWLDQKDNMKYFDRTKMFEITISITDENETFLKDYKEQLKMIFGQNEIYMIITTVYQV